MNTTASEQAKHREHIPYSAKVNATLVKSAIVAALGGLLFGFDTAVISGTTHLLIKVFSLSPGALGLTVSSALLGTIIGATCSGYAAERLGRRDSLRIMAVLYLLSAIGCAFAWNWPVLVIARIIGGIGIGGSSVPGPMYIAEISPPRLRGALVGIFQFNIVIGILVAYLSNFTITLQHRVREWRWELCSVSIAALDCLLGNCKEKAQ